MPVRIAERWFETRRVDDAITLLWEPHVIPLMRCNIWHVRGRDRDLLIDTGMGIASLREAARTLLEKPVIAVATHTHADHVGGHFEFEDCLVHRDEAEKLRQPQGRASLRASDLPPDYVAMLREAGYDVADELITALPHAGYDIDAYRIRPATPTRIVAEGSIVDTGDRRFEVLHLPGHSPGSIGLWEAATGILFSGDAIYDGPLLDRLGGSDIAAYVTNDAAAAGAAGARRPWRARSELRPRQAAGARRRLSRAPRSRARRSGGIDRAVAPDIVTLRAGAARLEVSPRLGGSIIGYWSVHDGRLDWLTPRARSPIAGFETCRLASFPLVPYSNRIRDDRFRFRGRTVEQPPRPGAEHVLHGHGRQRAWQIVASRDDALTIAYEHAPDAWPWAYRAEQRFALTEDGLTLTLAIENRSAEDMPAGLGHHPYFARTPKTRVTAEIGAIWLPEAGEFPTSHTAPPPDMDPRIGIEVDRIALDHAFADWSGSAVIEWPERGARLAVTMDPAPRTLIIFSPPDEDFVCVEPVSHGVDSFNLADQGMTDTGMRVLTPGERFELTVSLRPVADVNGA